MLLIFWQYKSQYQCRKRQKSKVNAITSKFILDWSHLWVMSFFLEILDLIGWLWSYVDKVPPLNYQVLAPPRLQLSSPQLPAASEVFSWRAGTSFGSGPPLSPPLRRTCSGTSATQRRKIWRNMPTLNLRQTNGRPPEKSCHLLRDLLSLCLFHQIEFCHVLVWSRPEQRIILCSYRI